MLYHSGVAKKGKRAGRRGIGGFFGMGILLALVLLAGAGDGTDTAPPLPAAPAVVGLMGDPSDPYPLTVGETAGSSFLPRSDVLRLPDGRLLYVPAGAERPLTVPPDDPGALAAAEKTRTWLGAGTVPGTSGLEREVASRALLNLRLLTRRNGAALASVRPGWDHVWPRDAAFVSAALSTTGHREKSLEILGFLARAQEPDGAWEARYDPDGTPVLDGRARQLDAVGWYCWALWVWYASGQRDARAEGELRELWPAARAAANAAASSLGPDGLPPGGADYWETETRLPNLGTAAPLRTGLRAAADLARTLGHEDEARRYARAAEALDGAIRREFAPAGYPRTTDPRSGANAAVTFLAPPFAPSEPQVQEALAETADRLRVPNGGLLPGEDWSGDPSVAWTPQTALFALSTATTDEAASERRLWWLVAHRTGLGAYPEKVDAAGEPRSAAPLAWTEALVVLTLAERGDVARSPGPMSGARARRAIVPTRRGLRPHRETSRPSRSRTRA